MADKENINVDCKAHSGVRAELNDLKQNNEKQWIVLDTLQTSKASSSQMKWVIGIFLIISISVVGFLWKAQWSSTDTIIKKIEVMETENSKKREETNLKLDVLKDKVNELKWITDEHLSKEERQKKGMGN